MDATPKTPEKLGDIEPKHSSTRDLPVDAFLGIVRYDNPAQRGIESEVESRGLSIPVESIPEWYF